MFNEELARRALQAIKNHPERWDQNVWRCETGMCFAGFVALEAGAVWTYSDTSTGNKMFVTTPDDGRIELVSDYAEEVLGLPAEMETYLYFFHSTNTLEQLEEAVDRYAGRVTQ